MSELEDLYQEMILDHYKRPRNHRVLPTADHHAEGRNPLCGDHVTVFVNLDNGKCWSSQFTTTRTNESNRVTAVIP